MTKGMIKLGKDRSYCVDFTKPNYLVGLTYVYFINIDDGKAFTFHEIDAIDPSVIDLLFSNKVVEQITDGINRESSSINWTWLIVGLLIGGMIASFVVMFVMQKRIDEILTHAIIVP